MVGSCYESYNDSTGTRIHWQEAVVTCDDFIVSRPGFLVGFVIGDDAYLLALQQEGALTNEKGVQPGVPYFVYAHRASELPHGYEIEVRARLRDLKRLRKTKRREMERIKGYAKPT